MLQDTVSNPAIGRMKLQFWRDAIKGIAEVRRLRRRGALAHEGAGRLEQAPATSHRARTPRGVEIRESAAVSLEAHHRRTRALFRDTRGLVLSVYSRRKSSRIPRTGRSSP